ncbi:MAG: hypothetical protein FJX34_03920 [Alphaproteobacteria bacterium]|nr:hypothetical protein [Alphaproteobacteria bacterium]
MKKIALVGTGPLGLGIVTQMADSLEEAKKSGSTLGIESIDIFDSYGEHGLGAGLPYDEGTTDPEHLLNVNSAGNKDVFGGFTEYLKAHEDKIRKTSRELEQKRLSKKPTDDKEEWEKKALREHYDRIADGLERRNLRLEDDAYNPRILMGERNIDLFGKALARIRACGVEVKEHSLTEVTDLTKGAGGIQLEYETKGEDVEDVVDVAKFDNVILATGKWRVRDAHPRLRHIPEVWPIADLKRDLNAIIRAEVKKGNPSKEIRIAVQGQSLSAIDAVKTIFNTGAFEQDDDGERFIPNPLADYRIKVDLVSRSGVMQAVKGKAGWQRPKNTEIKQSMLDEIASEQGGKIRLWQWMLLNSLALENAYRFDGQEEYVAQARSFTKLIIQQAGGDVVDDKSIEDVVFDCMERGHSSVLEQLKTIQSRFKLKLDGLDGVDYRPILAELNEKFFSKNPIEQLHDQLALAKAGDSKEGYLIWKTVYGQNDDLTLLPLLTPEESAFYLERLHRIRDAMHNGMPIQTAKELLALHKAGLLECRVVEADSRYDEERDAVVIRDRDGIEHTYSAVISARGYDTDIRKNAAPLFQSMLSKGYLILKEEPVEVSDEDVKRWFGVDFAGKFAASCEERDGRCYYSAGSYRATAVDQSHSMLVRLVDAAGVETVPGLFIPPSGGTGVAIKKGKEFFVQLLTQIPTTHPSSALATTSAIVTKDKEHIK